MAPHKAIFGALPLLQIQRPVFRSGVMPVLSRFKRTKALSPGASRLVNVLSVLSARKKQPRRLKLCIEDLVRHQTVVGAWRVFQRDRAAQRNEKLEKQYLKMKEACNELEGLDPELFEKATQRELGKRFPIELRVPTETPPRVPWQSDWRPPKGSV